MGRGIPDVLRYNDVKKLLLSHVPVNQYADSSDVWYVKIFHNIVLGINSTDCWRWTGYTTTGGYAVIKGSIRVSRLMWVMHNRQDLLEGDLVLHHCDNPPCCNPIHLYKGNASDNMKDVYARQCNTALKGHTTRGHTVLTTEQARAIDIMYASGKYLQQELADMFNTTQSTIMRIVNRRGRWATLS